MHWITAKFISKPAIDADLANLKPHLIYSRILGSALARQLSKTSKHRCSFGAEVDPSFDLRFELYSIGNNVHDDCSLNLCARSLSELMQSMDIDQRIFSNAVNYVLDADRRYTSFDFRRSPLLSALPAVSEVYRHIYPAGAIQRIARDTSEHDFLNVSFEEFVAWFKQQQSRLSDIEQGRGESPRDARPFSTLPAHPGESKCTQARDVDVQELRINHHGWGHRSLILVKNGFTTAGIGENENATLREFCQANNQGHPERLGASPWSEMAGKIRCFRQQLLGGDWWLILYSSQQPLLASVNMLPFAHRIAGTLSQNSCADADSRLFVADFIGPE